MSMIVCSTLVAMSASVALPCTGVLDDASRPCARRMSWASKQNVPPEKIPRTKRCCGAAPRTISSSCARASSRTSSPARSAGAPSASATARSAASARLPAARMPPVACSSGSAPRKIDTTGVVIACGLREHGRGDRRVRRLGDEHDDLRVGVVLQPAHPAQHRDAADRLGQVVAAGADRLRHAGAELVDARGDLLRAGARRADDADRAAAHDVREAQRDAVDDRGAAVGAHDDEVARVGRALDLELGSRRARCR